ncbi:mRNA (2'-O-methyladenosine-N(6)-)-methyltransferase [Trichinella spiralis]|uniref:mRNA (2'-O-methyladenosine-N(6)-)-methyltransferase n=1 Tax=Trichinella spiralis TaxID=6334 RepID=A0ABR3K8R4_TRISP
MDEKKEEKQEQKNEKKLSSEDENAKLSSTGEAVSREGKENCTDPKGMDKKPPDGSAATENNIYSEKQILSPTAEDEKTLSLADEETYRPTRIHWDSSVSWPIEMLWQQQANDIQMEKTPSLIPHPDMEQERDVLKKLKAAVDEQCTPRSAIIFDNNLIQQWLSAYKQSWPFKSNVLKKPKKYINKTTINYEILSSCASSSSASSAFQTQVECLNKRKPPDQYLKSSSSPFNNVQHPVKLNTVCFLEPSHCKAFVNEFQDKNDKKWIQNMLMYVLNNKPIKKMGNLQCKQFEKLEFFDCTLQLLAFIFDFALQLGKQILNSTHCNDEIEVDEKLAQLLVTSFKHSVDQLQFENDDSQFDWKMLISRCIDEADLQNSFGQTAAPFRIQMSKHLLTAFQNLCYYTICTLLLVPSAIPKLKMQKPKTEAALPNLIFPKDASYVVQTVGLNKHKLIRVRKGEAKSKAVKAKITSDKQQYFILFDNEKDHGSGVCFSFDKAGGDKAMQAFTAEHRSKVLKPLYSDSTVSLQWLCTSDLSSDVYVIHSSSCCEQISKRESKKKKASVTQQQNMDLQMQLGIGGEKQTANLRQDAFYTVGLDSPARSALENCSQEDREKIDADKLTTDEIVDEFLVALFDMPTMQSPCRRCLGKKPLCKPCYYINKYLPRVTKK